MGSSRPAFWDQQPSTRKEISRLLEIKGKTITFVEAMVFYFKFEGRQSEREAEMIA
jgi:hypothetical protein